MAEVTEIPVPLPPWWALYTARERERNTPPGRRIEHTAGPPSKFVRAG